MRVKLSIITLFSLLLINSLSHAESKELTKTKQTLNQLEAKIRLLQQNLEHVHNKQDVLKQELLITEKQINEGLQELARIKKDNATKEAEIKELQPQVDALSTQLHGLQSTLAKHVRARYKISENQPVTWLLQQDSPQRVDRLLTYYQYIIRSTQLLIDDVKTTQQILTMKQEKLNRDMLELQRIRAQWQTDQEKLTANKQYHTKLIQSLNQDIQTKQQTLETYRRNQSNLTRLLTTLAQQSVLQTRHPFTQMRRKLARPVEADKSNIQKINQGLIFYSQEGAPVRVVYPGKVVFADWLNGYGLLLIVDHGWGFMTLYANNLALFKQKGDTVNQGEKIATVGHSGVLRQNGLYFEIRHHGKAISPSEWLIA